MNPKCNTYPAVIVGGGMVGLLCAALLADAKLSVAIIEAKKPCLTWEDDHVASRVSAINIMSQRLLQSCGIQSQLREQAYCSLLRLVAWETTHGATLTFDSAEIGEPSLGAIIENREIVRVLWEKLQNHPYATILSPHTPTAIMQTKENIYLSLDRHPTIQTHCVIGADGGQSWLRRQMKISNTEYVDSQSALISIIQTQKQHEKTGWQAFASDSVLALLPHHHKYYSAMVWSMSSKQAHTLMSADESEFHRTLNHTFGTRLGKLKSLHPLKILPIRIRHAERYIANRMVLIGDAAHTIHPLAGQGVNLGFMDAACLAQCLITAHQQRRDIGNSRTLRQYERWRKGDNALMSWVTLGLKELFTSQSSLTIQARHWGLHVIDHVNPLKNYFMQLAIGNTGDVPQILAPFMHSQAREETNTSEKPECT